MTNPIAKKNSATSLESWTWRSEAVSCRSTEMLRGGWAAGGRGQSCSQGHAHRPTISVFSLSVSGSTKPTFRPRWLSSRAARSSCRALRNTSLLLVSVSAAARSISRLRSSDSTPQSNAHSWTARSLCTRGAKYARHPRRAQSAPTAVVTSSSIAENDGQRPALETRKGSVARRWPRVAGASTTRPGFPP